MTPEDVADTVNLQDGLVGGIANLQDTGTLVAKALYQNFFGGYCIGLKNLEWDGTKKWVRNNIR